MEFVDLLSRIAGLDSTKKYTISAEEINKPNETLPPVIEQPASPEPTIQRNTGEDHSDSIVELQKQLAALQEENKTIKEFNKQLVTHTPAGIEKTTEERIMEICAPQFIRREANG